MVTLSFDIPNQFVVVELPDTVLDVQELWNQTQDFLDTDNAMTIPAFIFGSGKNDLGAGDFVGITITLVDWRVKFSDQPGPTVVLTQIRGGNLVGRVGSLQGAVQHPVKESTFTFNTIIQSTSPALIDAGVPDESHLEVTYVETTSELRLGAWLDRSGVTVTAPTSATITWYNPDGTQLFQVIDSNPDAQGHFDFNLTQALLANTAYYAEVSVTDAQGTIVTGRGVPTAQ